MKKILALVLLCLAAASGQTVDQRMQWWRDARFGMFIHWGLYAVPAGEWKGQPIKGIGEWIMNRAKIPVGEYEQLAKQFNPVKFNADEWVAVAKNAGMKYIVITSKHHDGFAMFKSNVSKYNIVDATPFHRDPLKELAAACKKAGIRLCFYYSHAQDWHEKNGAGNTWDFGPDEQKDFAQYFEAKAKPQVRELLTGYGPIGLIWFDTPRLITKAQAEDITAMVHKLQPMCIVSGRVGHDVGDYVSARDNQVHFAGGNKDWEAPVTLNDTWGFKKDDHNWKSPQVLIRQMVTTASRGGNYLLNVGPTAEGIIPHESVERLAEVGKFMKANGESIYGSKGSPFSYNHEWGLITSKPGKLYLHVFEWPKGQLEIYGIESKVKRATLLAGRKPLTVTQQAESLRIALPPAAPDPNDSVIVLDFDGQPQVTKGILQQPDGSLTLDAYLAEVHHTSGAKLGYDTRGVIEKWTNVSDWLSWDFKVLKPGKYNVVVLTSKQKDNTNWEGGHRVALKLGAQQLTGVVKEDATLHNPRSPYWDYVSSKMGQVTVDRAGNYHLELKPQAIESAKKLGLTLVSVRLEPAG